MTRQEHLLTIAAEECSEVAQSISKALRFGLQEIQSGQPETNRGRIEIETAHLLAMLEMLGILNEVTEAIPAGWVREAMDSKQKKVERWLLYSQSCGTVAEASL